MDIYDNYPDLLCGDFVENFDLDNCHTRKGEAISELDVAVALLRFSGNVSKTAKAVGRARNVVAGFIARTRYLSDLQDDLRETKIDELEELHMKVAKDGDIATQRFFLTTLGAHRGYLKPTQMELSGRNGGPIQTNEVSARDRIAEKLASIGALKETKNDDLIGEEASPTPE